MNLHQIPIIKKIQIKETMFFKIKEQKWNNNSVLGEGIKTV
jgi:hypothetical protein